MTINNNDNQQLVKAVDSLVADMLSANIAEKKFYTDQRIGKEYPVLITVNAFEKEFIAIAVLGHPELAGVWSYTLLKQSRIDETTMEPYFKEFAKNDFGLIAVNPNFFAPDIEGDSFVYQLEQVIAEIAPDKKIGFIGFSMGGKILVDFLEQHSKLLHRTAGLVLIDPVFSNQPEIENIRQLLDNDTLLIASQDQDRSPGEVASILLGIPKISLPGIHGQMPNKALSEVISFYQQKML